MGSCKGTAGCCQTELRCRAIWHAFVAGGLLWRAVLYSLHAAIVKAERAGHRV